MIVRTEYSFRTAFGSVEAVLARCPEGAIIADDGCWGHVPFYKAAKKTKQRAGFGVRLKFGDAKNWRELVMVARSSGGLRDLYALVGEADRGEGRLPISRATGGDWLTIAAPARSGTVPELPLGVVVPYVPGLLKGHSVAFTDNYYPSPGDREAWLFALGRRAWVSSAPAHVLNLADLAAEGAPEDALRASRELLEVAGNVELPRADNVRFPVEDAPRELRAWAEAEFSRRGLGAEYRERLERELVLIAEKGFADYFLVIADMIRWAKERMLVGPGRGSSAGSLVCWLTGITTVDPIEHGLLFERFIDVNRFDLPDIDIDFPDEGRGSVLDYLAQKYGAQNVAHIGTVMRYKPKSALTDVAKELNVPPWELDSFKDVIIERSSGDSRVNDCLADSFAEYEAGRRLIEKWPQLIVATKLEGGARQSGKHAAGMIVCNEPVEQFAAVNREGVAQIDKKSAEALNVLKIDALGLRTLSVLQSACEEAGIDYRSLYDLPLDDANAIAVFNNRQWSGIFQFEGAALRSIADLVRFDRFTDISALTALARPGPLASGEAKNWIERKHGRALAVAPHPALEAVTLETYGTILYQEQVMMTTREIGQFDWASTAAIRKLMSNRSGDESFRKFETMFLEGASARGVEEEDARRIWSAINSFGSWAFNKSHAVVYGVVSYWCAWMKAHHPLAFALGCLKHARDDDSAKQILRELSEEGFTFVPLDAQRSEVGWSMKDGELIGGLTGVPGVGEKVAREIIARRRNGIPLSANHEKLLARGSVFASIFPCREKWGHIYRDPAAHGIRRAPLVEIERLEDGAESVVIGKAIAKSVTDLNSDHHVKRRGYVYRDKTKMLVLRVEDDTGQLIALVGRYQFDSIGKELIEKVVAGETWLMLRGKLNSGKFFNVEAYRWLKPA